MMDRYGTVTEVATIRAAKGMDLLFQSYRQLSDAPDLGLPGIDFKKLPKAPDAGLPGPGGFEDYVRGAKNIGPEGMQTREQFEAMKRNASAASKIQTAAMRQISTIATDLSRSIVDTIFGGGQKIDTLPIRRSIDELKQSEKDLLAEQSKGKNVTAQLAKVRLDLKESEDKLTDAIKKQGLAYKALKGLENIGESIAKSLARSAIEASLQRISKAVIGLIGDMGGLGKVVGKVFGGASGPGGTIFSAAGSAGGSVASAAGSAGGGVASTVGGIAGSAVTGIVGAVAGVVGAVSGVIGNFQMMGMNKSLDIIVKHTLQTANDLANLRADEWTREGHLFAKLDDMWKTNLNIYDLLGKNMALAGGSSVVINLNGGDPKQVLEEITRMLKQYGVIPKG